MGNRPASERAKRGVLVAVRDASIAAELTGYFAETDVEVRVAHSTEDAWGPVLAGACEIAVVDAELGGDPLELVSALLARAPALNVIALTQAERAELCVEAVRRGATDFIRVPLTRGEVQHVLTKSLHLVAACASEPPASSRPETADPWTAASAAMRDLETTLVRAAASTATVLVRGETGSGKDVVARSVHARSQRSSGPFVKVHCGALPDNLLESELFGYEKGAFTGAVARKPGRVELAEGGTLFLDEIGDITPAVQIKLLRVLQDREFEPLGGTRTLRADVRFVAATHRDLESLVAKGAFREDLFYRLNVISLWVPPLRTRPQDVERLAIEFCRTIGAQYGKAAVAFDVQALDLLKAQPWPGNVRQLQNFVERLVVLSTGTRIDAAQVEGELRRQSGPMGLAVASGYVPPLSKESSLKDLGTVLKQAEKRALEKALRCANGNRAAAARLLGISQRSLYYKLEEHRIAE